MVVVVSRYQIVGSSASEKATAVLGRKKLRYLKPEAHMQDKTARIQEKTRQVFLILQCRADVYILHIPGIDKGNNNDRKLRGKEMILKLDRLTVFALAGNRRVE